MNKPYIVRHMMTSVDGRIDCVMTAQLAGVDAYYETLNALETQTTLTGRVTAALELSLAGSFKTENPQPYGKEGFSKKTAAAGYEIVVDTRGTLLWNDDSQYDAPHLIVTSENVSRAYLDYLDSKNISWIACGKDRIDLKRAAAILADKFDVKRMAVVGGSKINSAFLSEGLLDEISLLIGAGIDGRGGMPAVFDGFDANRPVTALKLQSVKAFDDGAVWLRYIPKYA